MTTRPIRRRLAALVALVCVVGVVGGASAPPASASHLTYYSGTLTENYHNFGACFYSIGSACSGWNYWTGNGASWAQTNGSNWVGLDDSTSLRGDEVFGSFREHWVLASSVGFAGRYIRGSLTIWTATVTSVNAASTCMDPQDCS